MKYMTEIKFFGKNLYKVKRIISVPMSNTINSVCKGAAELGVQWVHPQNRISGK
jgi:hypothetical protein